MGFFSNPQEAERKANLKKMEDKRLAFAQAMETRGFKPEKMLFSQLDNGGLLAVCRFEGRQWLILGPGFGEDGARALGIPKSDPEYDPHKVYLKDIFRFVETGMSETGEILGRYEPTGYMPKDLLRKAFLNRVQYDKNIFVPDPDIDVGEAMY